MKIQVPAPLKLLSEQFDKPIYLVGGYVRDYILHGKISSDVDLCAPILADELEKVAKEVGFSVVATYKKTGTVKLKYGEQEFEYTTFRTEEYEKGGFHTPYSVEFTSDIVLDAKRRDFKINAIYYDIKNGKIVDVLGGLHDLRHRKISTVIAPEDVFMHDGLRLLRLARFSAKHSLSIDKEMLKVAKKYNNLIVDIAPERIKDELNKMLCEDERTTARALKVLEKIGVLDFLFKTNDIKCAKIVSSVKKELRLLTLCTLYSKSISDAVFNLNFLKISKRDIKDFTLTLRLIGAFFGNTKTISQIKRLVIDNFNAFSDFSEIVSAIISNKKNNKRLVQKLSKWENVKNEIINSSVPMSVQSLKISAKELIDLGIEANRIKSVLNFLLNKCQKNPKLNAKEKLKILLKKHDFIS